ERRKHGDDPAYRRGLRPVEAGRRWRRNPRTRRLLDLPAPGSRRRAGEHDGRRREMGGRDRWSGVRDRRRHRHPGRGRHGRRGLRGELEAVHPKFGSKRNGLEAERRRSAARACGNAGYPCRRAVSTCRAKRGSSKRRPRSMRRLLVLINETTSTVVTTAPMKRLSSDPVPAAFATSPTTTPARAAFITATSVEVSPSRREERLPVPGPYVSYRPCSASWWPVTKYGSSPGAISRKAWRGGFMPDRSPKTRGRASPRGEC